MWFVYIYFTISVCKQITVLRDFIFASWFHIKYRKNRRKTNQKIEKITSSFHFTQTAIWFVFITTALPHSTWVIGVKSKYFSVNIQPFIKTVLLYLITTETVRYCLVGCVSKKMLICLKSQLPVTVVNFKWNVFCL